MLLPSNLSIYNSFDGSLPEEPASKGELRYFVHTTPKYSISYDEIRGVLVDCLKSEARMFAGAKTGIFLNTEKWSYVKPVNEAKRDILYDLGYNPIIPWAGLGTFIQDNVLGDTLIRLPEVVVDVDILIALGSYLQGIFIDKLAADQSAAEVGMMFNEMTARRIIQNGISTTEGQYGYAKIDAFWTTIHYSKQKQLTRYTDTDEFVASPELTESLECICALYPNLCRQIEIGHAPLFVFNNLHIRGKYYVGS